MLLLCVCCLFQSVYGIASVADLTGPGPAHSAFMLALQQQKQTQQKAQLSAWQQVVQQIVKRLQSANQFLREAACKAGADVLKRGPSPPFFCLAAALASVVLLPASSLDLLFCRSMPQAVSVELTFGLFSGGLGSLACAGCLIEVAPAEA